MDRVIVLVKDELPDAEHIEAIAVPNDWDEDDIDRYANQRSADWVTFAVLEVTEP